MPRRRSNLGRRTRRAEAMRRVIANKTEEERASMNEQNRQRMAEIRAEEATEERATRLKYARLLARRSRSAASDLLRSRRNERDRLRMVERRKLQQSRHYNRLTFRYDPDDCVERFTVGVKCEPNDVSREALNKAFEHLERAIEIFSSHDLNAERSSMVVEGIKTACSYYFEKYEEMKRERGKMIKKEIKSDTDASDKP